jgi:hypothetical protein
MFSKYSIVACFTFTFFYVKFEQAKYNNEEIQACKARIKELEYQVKIQQQHRESKERQAQESGEQQRQQNEDRERQRQHEEAIQDALQQGL